MISGSNVGEDRKVAAKKGNLKSVADSSVRQRVSSDEWEMRCDLAAAYQLAALF